MLEYSLLYPIDYSFQGNCLKLKKIRFKRPSGRYLTDGKLFSQINALKSAQKVSDLLQNLKASLDEKKNSNSITELEAFTELVNLLIKKAEVNHLENKIKLENDVFNSLKDIYFRPRDDGIGVLSQDVDNSIFLTIEEFKDFDFQDLSNIFQKLKDFFFLTLS